VGLLWICAYLYSQLRASRAQAQKTEDAAEQATLVIDLPEPYVHIRKSQMLDVEMQAWRHDAISTTVHLNAYETARDAVGLDKYCKPGDEAWAADLLAELGYKGGLAAPTILCLLRQWDSFRHVENYIISDVVLQRLSLEGDPEDSLLPFTPDVHRGLRDFYKALEETKCKFRRTEHFGYIANTLCEWQCAPKSRPLSPRSPSSWPKTTPNNISNGPTKVSQNPFAFSTRRCTSDSCILSESCSAQTSTPRK